MTRSTGLRAFLERFIRPLTYFAFFAHRKTLRFPKIVLIIGSLLCVFFTIRIELMPRYFTMNDNLDPKLPVVLADKVMERDFKVGQSLFLVFKSSKPQGISAEAMCAINRWLRQGVYNVKGQPDISTVTSPFSVRQVTVDGSKLWFAPMFKPNCDREDPEPTQAYIASSMEINGILSSTPWKGLFSTESGNGDILAEIELKGSTEKTGVSVDNIVALHIDDSLRKTLGAFPEVSWDMSGPVAFRAYAKVATDRDLLVNSLIPVLLAIAFRLFYGTWIGGLLLGISLIVMRSFLLGLMALSGYSADPLTGSLILLVSMAGVADFLFVTRYQQKTGASWRRAYQRFLIPSFLTSLTTAFGFLCLMSSDIKTVRDLGMWATIGTFIQWFSVYFFIPCIHSVWPRSRVWAVASSNSLARLNDQLAQRSLPKFCRYLVLPLMIGGLLSMPFLLLEDSLNSFLPKEHPFSRAGEYLRSSRGWDGAVSVVIKSTATEKQRHKLVQSLQTLAAVARIESGQEMVKFLIKDLAQLDSEMVQRFISVDDSYLRRFSSQGDERLSVYVRESNLDQIQSVMNAVKANCPSTICYATGPLPIFVEFSEAVVVVLFRSFAESLIIVCLFLCFYTWWQRKKCFYAVLTSSLTGPLVMTGLMFVFQVPINFVNCFFGAIMVGMAGDNAIQYLYASPNRPLEEGIEARAGGSIEVMLCMQLLALMLLASAFLPPKTLGIILALGLAVNLCGDLWVLKLLLQKSPDSRVAQIRS